MPRLDLTHADTEPLAFSERLELSAESAGEDVVSISDVEITGVVERGEHGYVARGEVGGRIMLRCARCLTSFPFTWSDRFELTLLPAAPAGSEDETRLGKGDLEVHFFSEPFLDLEELTGEQLQLALPMKPLCREGCAGLCPRCGAELNKGACTCAPETDERWAPLEGWRPSN